MPVKDIAQKVSLTSPAVSSRIHRLEQEGIIGGYTDGTLLPLGRITRGEIAKVLALL